MNYFGFTHPVWAFLAGIDHRWHKLHIDADDFAELLARGRRQLPFAIQLAQLNLLDSHDTPRLIHLVKGDKALFKLGISLLLTYIGVPCIYYGDEIGLDGGSDPDCRRTMPWDEALWDSEIRAYYQKLITLRHQAKVLQEGDCITLYASGNIFAYARLLGNDVVVVVINRGEAGHITLDMKQVGLVEARFESIEPIEGFSFEVAQGQIKLELNSKSALILKRSFKA